MDDHAHIERLFLEIQELLPDCSAPYIRRKIRELQGVLEERDQAGNMPAYLGDEARIVSDAQALMAANMQPPLTIAQLAEACGTSPTTLKKAFRNVLDTPVFQWYRDLRIEHSKKLLLETDLSIARVAAAVGYANPSKFSRAFQEHEGATPRTWRSQALRQAPGEGCE